MKRILYLIQCRMCHEIQEIEVDEYRFKLWSNGLMNIQKALPELSPEQREMFISQTCGKCWNKMFRCN